MSDGTKRHIRLKEFGINVARDLAPAEAYLRDTNGTIDAGPYRLRTDAEGFITSPQAAEAEGAPVYLLGDSFVESSFVQEGARFADLLCGLDAGGEGRRFLNAGYSGATSLNILSLVLTKILPAPGGSLLYVLPSNDVLSLYNPRGFWNRADKRYSPLQPAQAESASGPLPLRHNLGQLQATLTALVGLARAFNLKLYLSPCPFVSRDYEDLPWHRARHRAPGAYAALIADRDRANAVVRETAARLHVPLIDLNALLDDPQWFYDDVHLNAAGSAVAAQKIHENL
jgi:lysophospholipase L1-like esterase